MKKLYLSLAVIGAFAPDYFFYQFIQAEGVNLKAFISALFVNGAAGSFTVDLLLTSFIFWLFMFQQFKKSNGPKPYIFMVLNIILGLCFAMPAYLYAREKHGYRNL